LPIMSCAATIEDETYMILERGLLTLCCCLLEALRERNIRGSEICQAYAVLDITTIDSIAIAIAQGLMYTEDMRNKIWRIFKVEMTQNNTIRIAKKN
jgi:hypothetical protein